MYLCESEDILIKIPSQYGMYKLPQTKLLDWTPIDIDKLSQARTLIYMFDEENDNWIKNLSRGVINWEKLSQTVLPIETTEKQDKYYYKKESKYQKKLKIGRQQNYRKINATSRAPNRRSTWHH